MFRLKTKTKFLWNFSQLIASVKYHFDIPRGTERLQGVSKFTSYDWWYPRHGSGRSINHY